MKVIAHRGSSQVAPENTLPAIKKAIRDGADAIEIDVQLTKDKEIVVIHDEWLNRTTNGNGFVCDTTFREIRNLDAGAWFQSSYKGSKVPHLEEILPLVQQHGLELNIELKNNVIPYKGIEQRVIDAIYKHGVEQQVIISSFRRDSLEICKNINVEVRRGILCWSTLDPLYDNLAWRDLALHSIHPHLSLLKKDISYLQEKGYKIYPYLIGRKSELARCLKYNVDGVFTNCPGRVKQLIHHRA